MKKKTIANIGMVLAIIAIVLSGIFAVGHIRGWFDKPDDNVALLTNYRGIITIERESVAYTAKEDTYLRAGDKITCDPGSTVRVLIGEDYIVLGQSAQVEIVDATIAGFFMEVKKGEVFVNTDSELTLGFDKKQVCFTDTVASLSVRSGVQSVSVFYGSVEEALEGQMLEWIGDDVSVRTCAIQSLNDFLITEIKQANETKALVFTKADLEKLETDRWEAIAGEDASEKESEDDNASTETEPPVNDEPPVSSEAPPVESENPSDSEKPPVESEKPSDSEKPPVESETPPPSEEKPEKPKLSCTITIRCDTILDNWDNLDPAKAAYVPSNGCILPNVTVEFTEGETVFDVLKRVCDQYEIAIEYSWTPMYDSYYIEGINNLYEFDCGSESGWMYKVNEWFPNYGCSSYTLTGGENIVWCYTCVGLGKDVGAEGW